MSLDHLSVRLRIVLGFSVPIVLFIGFAVFLTLRLGSVKEQISVVKNERIVYALLAKDMAHDVTQIQQFLTDVSATRALNGLSDGWKEAESHNLGLLSGIEKFQKFYQTKADKNQLDVLADIKAKADQFYSQGKKMAQAYVEGGPEQGNAMMPEFDKASLQLQASLAPFVDRQVMYVNSGSESAMAQADMLVAMAL